MTNLPPRVGNYQLERQIGKGGMSEVWLARHRLLEDRQVAVKLLLSQDPEWIERFTREANITSRLRQENIIQIYDHGYQHPYYYTVMEYVIGGALRELLRGQKPLPLPLALHVFRRAGAALDYAHTHGVIHRDVSPGNILIEQGTHRVLLTDFGIARESGKTGMTTVNKLMGTPGYLSPEHASSATAVTHLSDVFGLGVVLFEMLTGMLPWNHNPGMPDSSGGVFTSPMSLQSRGLQGLPADVDRIIQTMLALDPAKRYPSAQAAIEDMDQALSRHTSPTQVIVPLVGAVEPGRIGATMPRSVPLCQPQGAEPHPVEKALGPDLLKGPMQEARKRAELLCDQQEIAALLNRWSEEGRFRRRLLGRQALCHRVTSTNVYFYTLRVLYETRDPVKVAQAPDHKALAAPLEKEQERWEVELPALKGFVEEAGGTVRLPGSTRVIACSDCKGVGRTVCPRCQGRQRIIDVGARPAPSAAPKPSTSASGGASPPKVGGGAGSVAPRSPAAGSLSSGAPLVSSAPPLRSEPVLIPCPECSGIGGLVCVRCAGVGRLIERKTTTWRRSTASFSANDDLPRLDERWLQQNCQATDVYREQQQGGFRAEWSVIPLLAELIAEARTRANDDTHVILSEVAIAFIPVTEILFDLGEVAAMQAPAGGGKGKVPAASADAGLYRWHIYGFERRLPNDWRFLNWDQVMLILAAVLVCVLLVGLVVMLRR